eukprot:3406142-Rhodomonas_salina.1
MHAPLPPVDAPTSCCVIHMRAHRTDSQTDRADTETHKTAPLLHEPQTRLQTPSLLPPPPRLSATKRALRVGEGKKLQQPGQRRDRDSDRDSDSDRDRDRDSDKDKDTDSDRDTDSDTDTDTDSDTDTDTDTDTDSDSDSDSEGRLGGGRARAGERGWEGGAGRA